MHWLNSRSVGLFSSGRLKKSHGYGSNTKESSCQPIKRDFLYLVEMMNWQSQEVSWRNAMKMVWGGEAIEEDLVAG